MKFQAIYRVTVYNQDGTVIIGAHEEKDKDGNVRIVQDEAQLTCHFNVSRGVLSDCNRCNIQLYNLAPTTRNRIFQDMFQPFIEKWKFVKLEAGYDNDLSVIFMGRIMQAYSYKSGGQTDVITEIQAQALDMFDRNVSCTFAAGTSYKEALNTMVTTSMPNVSVGNVGNLEGTFQTPTTFEGGAMANINKLCGGNAFVDNNQLNVIMSNEVIDVPVPVINETNGLLDTPNRRDANLEVKMLFEPKLIVGQLLQIESKVQTDFNGQYKIVGITHDCLISGTQAGKRTTTVNLYIGPFLPGAEIVVSGQKQNNFNKVKGNTINPVTEKLPSQAREVFEYFKKNGKAPHSRATRNIYWDELIKKPSINYESPTISILTNVFYCATRIQEFVDKYYPGARIQINSAWRSRGYNATLSNADPNSEHLYGNAIDFKLIGYNTTNVYNIFLKFWRGRKYLHQAYDFIHADTTVRRGVYANDW